MRPVAKDGRSAVEVGVSVLVEDPLFTGMENNFVAVANLLSILGLQHVPGVLPAACMRQLLVGKDGRSPRHEGRVGGLPDESVAGALKGKIAAQAPEVRYVLPLVKDERHAAHGATVVGESESLVRDNDERAPRPLDARSHTSSGRAPR